MTMVLILQIKSLKSHDSWLLIGILQIMMTFWRSGIVSRNSYGPLKKKKPVNYFYVFSFKFFLINDLVVCQIKIVTIIIIIISLCYLIVWSIESLIHL